MKTSRSNISAPLSAVSQQLSVPLRSNDPSYDVIFGLALAYDAAQRMKDAGVDLSLAGQSLLFPFIERAYREALYVRAHRFPSADLDVSNITKFGRLV